MIDIRSGYNMMFPFLDNAVAAESTKTQTEVSTNQINIPLDVIAGSTLGVFVLFFTVVWWVRGLSAKVEIGEKSLSELGHKFDVRCEEQNKHHKELKEDIRLSFKTEISQSASDICHGFELFAMEIRSELKKLGEGLDARNATVNRLGKKVDHLSGEMLAITKQLQGYDIPVHYRQHDNGPPSNPYNYDDD
jgi:hypothetical protein